MEKIDNKLKSIIVEAFQKALDDEGIMSKTAAKNLGILAAYASMIYHGY